MDVETVAVLRTPDGLSALATATALVPGGDPLAAASALRDRGVPSGLAAAALTQATLRLRAAGKFGADAGVMLFTRDGLEQATRAPVAARRARRLVAAGVTDLVDLGCGLGADTIACARAGIRVTAVDADPLTAALAGANVAALGLADRVTVIEARAEDLDTGTAGAAFCDPARRRGGNRVFDPASFAPSWDFVTGLIARVPRTVVKLAPGIDHALLPPGAEAQWVSVGGEVVEAALWCGPLAEVPRRATLIREAPAGGDPTGGVLIGGVPAAGDPTASDPTAGDPGGGAVAVELTGTGRAEAPVGPVGPYLYDPDGAVLRAHLVAEFAARVGGRIADPTIAYVYADAAIPTPFARCYAVGAAMPFSLKRLRAALRERGVGRLTVKKRGSALVPEQLRRDLRLSGPNEATIVLTRVAGAQTVLLCQPVSG